MKRTFDPKKPICSVCRERNAYSRRNMCWPCYRADLEKRRALLPAVIKNNPWDHPGKTLEATMEASAVDLLVNDILNLKG